METQTTTLFATGLAVVMRAADLLGDVEESWRAPRGEPEPDAYWLLRRNLEAAILRIER